MTRFKLELPSMSGLTLLIANSKKLDMKNHPVHPFGMMPNEDLKSTVRGQELILYIRNKIYK
jgi:hypothetical protein